ncbi:PadR family transcriptional regulator [[Actinomadura] parvosata subsp. kistnae]|uniref:PadR family transcriptional regulator n=2 Tax=Nonomuraea TaxID=83681 RepID=A0A1V0ACQ4_9ACTN|nr:MULTISPECIES: PadR family transcriptional regulator [unclassified Nonomuraea]AQZ67949.1 PadR family transcriptional regulator [Nonomuraea sp. ATCC 55076]NJP91467.1 PadR family transcriptional regulator [Nonomuraea sp. FMUSA5-5]
MSLRHAVLGLLSEGPASGYDLMKTFDVSLANVWPATQSQLYSELGKLADAGLVDVVAEGPRGRKEYAITEEGLAELRRWVTDVPPTRVMRSDMLLRVFFLAQVSPEQARTYLRGLAEEAAKSLEHMESIRPFVESGADNLSVYGRLALEYGLRLAKSQKEWAEWAEGTIR